MFKVMLKFGTTMRPPHVSLRSKSFNGKSASSAKLQMYGVATFGDQNVRVVESYWLKSRSNPVDDLQKLRLMLTLPHLALSLAMFYD